MSKIRKLYLKHKETTFNAFWRNLQVLIRGGTFLIIFFAAAKMLSPDKFGLLNYFMAVLTALMIFCDFGISSATSKYVAEYKAVEPKKINKIFCSVSALIIGISTAFSLLIILLGKALFRENYVYALVFLPQLFMAPMTSTLDGFYRGLKEFKKMALIYVVVGPASLIISFFLIKRYLLLGTILSLNIVYILSASSLFIFRRETRFEFDKVILKKIAKYALSIGLKSITLLLFFNADILIMKQFGYLVEIGYYGIIWRIFKCLFLPAIILGEVIAPNITRYAAFGDYASIKSKLLKYLVILVGFSVLIIIIFYFAIPVLLKRFLPQYYTPTFLTILNMLLIILPFKIWMAFFMNGFVRPIGYVTVTMAWAYTCGILNIIFDYIFIWLLGFIGIFWVTVVINPITICANSFIVYRKIKLAAQTK